MLEDQIAAYDRMRRALSGGLQRLHLHWSLFRHADVMRVLNDHDTFSNAVSSHLSVPNGMDPPEHTEYRKIIDRSLRTERMQAFEPVCREIAVNLAEGLPAGARSS